MEKEDINFLVKELYQIDFFSNLSSDEVDAILKKFYKHTFRKGTVIVKQGSPGKFFALIHSGKIKVKVKKYFIINKLIAELDAGSYFGEISLISAGRKRQPIG